MQTCLRKYTHICTCYDAFLTQNNVKQTQVCNCAILVPLMPWGYHTCSKSTSLNMDLIDDSWAVLPCMASKMFHPKVFFIKEEDYVLSYVWKHHPAIIYHVHIWRNRLGSCAISSWCQQHQYCRSTLLNVNTWCIGKYNVSSYSVLYRQCVLILNVTWPHAHPFFCKNIINHMRMKLEVFHSCISVSTCSVLCRNINIAYECYMLQAHLDMMALISVALPCTSKVQILGCSFPTFLYLTLPLLYSPHAYYENKMQTLTTYLIW